MRRRAASPRTRADDGDIAALAGLVAPPGRGLASTATTSASRCSTTSSTRRSASSPAAPVAWEVAQRVKGHLNRVRRLSLPQPRYLEEMVAEHRLVLEALAQRRPRRRRGGAAPPPADGPVGAAGDPRAAPRLLRGGRTPDGDRDGHAARALRADAPDPASSRPRPSASTRRRGSAATATSPRARRRRRSARSHALDADDLLVTGYRCHGFALARGVPAEAVMAELFGPRRRLRPRPRRLDAPARRRRAATTAAGASSPASCRSPPASRSALVRQGRQQAVLCELGDGAINMGAWHESLNLAAVWHLPVVFLVMNNEYGMGTSVERASAVTELYRRAAAYDLPAERVDGDDLLAVAQACRDDARRRARGAPRRPCSSSSPTATAATRSPTPGSPTARAARSTSTSRPRPDLPRPRAARRRRASTRRRARRRCAPRPRSASRRPSSAALAEPARPTVGTLAARHVRAGQRRAVRAACCRARPFGERELVFAGGLGRVSADASPS